MQLSVIELFCFPKGLLAASKPSILLSSISKKVYLQLSVIELICFTIGLLAASEPMILLSWIVKEVYLQLSVIYLFSNWKKREREHFHLFGQSCMVKTPLVQAPQGLVLETSVLIFKLLKKGGEGRLSVLMQYAEKHQFYLILTMLEIDQ